MFSGERTAGRCKPTPAGGEPDRKIFDWKFLKRIKRKKDYLQLKTALCVLSR
jgi:hypothetical protein